MKTPENNRLGWAGSCIDNFKFHQQTCNVVTVSIAEYWLWFWLPELIFCYNFSYEKCNWNSNFWHVKYCSCCRWQFRSLIQEYFSFIIFLAVHDCLCNASLTWLALHWSRVNVFIWTAVMVYCACNGGGPALHLGTSSFRWCGKLWERLKAKRTWCS